MTVKTHKNGEFLLLLLGPTGISTINIVRTNTYSGLGIKPGAMLLGLNDKSKAALKNRLSEVNFLIINYR